MFFTQPPGLPPPTTGDVDALHTRIDSLEAINSDQSEQIRTLLAALAVVAKAGAPANDDDGSQDFEPVQPCDAASTPGAPSVVADEVGSLEVQACGGKITFRSGACAVDPCALEARVAATERRLAGLADLE